MGIKYRKQKPSMPHWWRNTSDACIFCKSRNNCSQCKFARTAAKEMGRKARRKMKPI